MIADICWIFSGWSLERVEVMALDELMGWHRHAVARKQADHMAMQGAVAMALKAMSGG